MDSSGSLENLEVKAYSGFKRNERPVSFIVSGVEKKVVDIKDRWMEPDKDCFKVLADDDMIYILCWDRERDMWNIEKMVSV